MKNLKILIAINIFIVLSGFSQNLVKNYSFENYNYTSCDIADDFSNIVIDWDSPNSLEGDVYFTTISQDCYYFQPNSTYPGPIGLKGTEYPAEGDVFAGIWVYTINGTEQREYVRGELSSPLEVGESYRLKLKISLADYIEYYIGELGIAFFGTQNVSLDGDLVIAEPQLIIHSGLDQSEDWFEYHATFTCDDHYNYFIIGNFKSDAETEIFPNQGATNEPGTYGAYYFLDDVSIELEEVNLVNESDRKPIVIYPTIVNTHINLKTKENNIHKYQIINQSGRIMKANLFNIHTSGGIDCSDLNSGLYFLICFNENNEQISIHKFIKVE